MFFPKNYKNAYYIVSSTGAQPSLLRFNKGGCVGYSREESESRVKAPDVDYKINQWLRDGMGF